jgi:hypothetical protein
VDARFNNYLKDKSLETRYGHDEGGYNYRLWYRERGPLSIPEILFRLGVIY